jgi:RNA polymerase sigma factor (sigma-70 family)
MAQEATQQAFVELLRCWAQRRFCTIDQNRRYVAGIIWHKIVDQLRHRIRMTEFDDSTRAPSVPQPLESELEYRALLRCIDEQPTRQRAVAIMYFLEDMTCEQIAAAMGTKASTVRTQLQRARKELVPYAERLRDALQDGGR